MIILKKWRDNKTNITLDGAVIVVNPTKTAVMFFYCCTSIIIELLCTSLRQIFVKYRVTEIQSNVIFFTLFSVEKDNSKV